MSPSVPEMGGIYASGEEEGGEVERGTLVCAFYEDVPLVEVMQLRSLLLYLCYVFRAIINSLVC